jgi:hypothetical protein
VGLKLKTPRSRAHTSSGTRKKKKKRQEQPSKQGPRSESSRHLGGRLQAQAGSRDSKARGSSSGRVPRSSLSPPAAAVGSAVKRRRVPWSSELSFRSSRRRDLSSAAREEVSLCRRASWCCRSRKGGAFEHCRPFPASSEASPELKLVSLNREAHALI